MEISLQVPQKAIPLWLITREIKSTYLRNIYIPVFMVALFTIATI
jgi:hypothetical protein